jgi:RNA polymerase sigma-70 factor (ECF subfamily)
MPNRHTAELGQDYETALLQCAAGDEAGVALIYRSEAHRLRTVARQIVRSRERADDVIHDAFVQILRDARYFDPLRGSARAWIYAIVRNTALKSYRSAGREIAVDNEVLFSMWEFQEVAEPAFETTDYADLRNCLDALEPNRRASLIMAIVDGQTHAEIAASLCVPIGTVKSWIRRELVSLREQLRSDEAG